MKKSSQKVVKKAQKPSKKTFNLPVEHQENRLVLLVRDPWWLFAYWEMTPRFSSDGEKALRVYDVTGGDLPSSRSYFDIRIGAGESWYIEVGIPDREWIAEIGFLSNEGCFVSWARSNRVTTPRYGVSDVIDKEWALSDELSRKLYGLTGVPSFGLSSK